MKTRTRNWTSMMLGFAFFSTLAIAPLALASEEWHGAPNPSQWNVGVMNGLGLFDGNGGYTFLFTGAGKVTHQGFVPDINNQVFAEVQVGPLWVKSATAIQYSFHLRWDFVRDSDWTYYALAGLGGLTGGEALGNPFRLYPRFGAGLFYTLVQDWKLRAEVSHEWIVFGINFAL